MRRTLGDPGVLSFLRAPKCKKLGQFEGAGKEDGDQGSAGKAVRSKIIVG